MLVCIDISSLTLLVVFCLVCRNFLPPYKYLWYVVLDFPHNTLGLLVTVPVRGRRNLFAFGGGNDPWWFFGMEISPVEDWQLLVQL